jgi:hypothetical protein
LKHPSELRSALGRPVGFGRWVALS